MADLQENNRAEPRGRHFSRLLLVAAALVAGFLLINSPLFAIGTVVVEGNKYTSQEDIYHIADIPTQVNTFRLRTDDIKERLLHDLRIAAADVSRRLPGTVVIVVTERQPVAYIAGRYGFLELDKSGLIMSVHKNLRQIQVPMITGLRAEGGYVGDTLEIPAVSQVLHYLALLDESTLNKMSEVNVAQPDKMTAYTVNSVLIHLGNAERLEEKAQLTNRIVEEVNQQVPIEYIDLTYASPTIKFKSAPAAMP